MLNVDSSLTVYNSRFERNSATSTADLETRGGAIVVENVAKINIEHTLF